MQPPYLPALSAASLDLELVLVRTDSLEPAASADLVLQDACGGALSSIQMGTTEWRRRPAIDELTVAMLRPLSSFEGQTAVLDASLQILTGMIQPHGFRPLGGGGHPWFDSRQHFGASRGRPGDPLVQTLDALDRPGLPGWADTRAATLSFPFLDDEDFRPLYAALRLIVPILPALAAASPYRDGRRGDTLDERIAAAQARAVAIPALGGTWYPEATVGVHAYRDAVLEPLRSKLAPLDPEGRLSIDDLNARGAVARFGPRILQLRAADMQECPAQDVAIAAIVLELARALVRGDWLAPDEQMVVASQTLATLGNRILREGPQASLGDAAALYGVADGSTAGEMWSHLGTRFDLSVATRSSLDLICREGTLAARMLRKAGNAPDRDALRRLVEALADCMASGAPFVP